MSSRPSAVIFDRDGVLVEVDEARLAQDVLRHIPLPRAEIERCWRRFLDGRALADAASESRAMTAFLTSLADELDLDLAAREALLRVDYAGAVRAFPDARGALGAVRRSGLRVGVLTNNTAGVSARRMLAVVGLDDLVDAALSAQMIGAQKPEIAAYRAAAGVLGVPASECLFFDDKRVSVDAARAAGMRAWEVDRSRPDHDIEGGVVRDLTAVEPILRAFD